MPPGWRLTPFERHMHSLRLRALDARLEGQSYREIAAQLLDPEVATLRAAEWKTTSARSKVLRLVGTARRFSEGAYRVLLNGG